MCRNKDPQKNGFGFSLVSLSTNLEKGTGTRKKPCAYQMSRRRVTATGRTRSSSMGKSPRPELRQASSSRIRCDTDPCSCLEAGQKKKKRQSGIQKEAAIFLTTGQTAVIQTPSCCPIFKCRSCGKVAVFRKPEILP